MRIVNSRRRSPAVRLPARSENAVDQAPFARAFCIHEMVAVQRALDLLVGPAAMFGVEAGDASLGLERLLGVNEDVGRLSLEPAERLMDVEAGVGQRRALARLPGHQEKRPHGPGGP